MLDRLGGNLHKGKFSRQHSFITNRFLAGSSAGVLGEFARIVQPFHQRPFHIPWNNSASFSQAAQITNKNEGYTVFFWHMNCGKKFHG
jgi:hypothetical protein